VEEGGEAKDTAEPVADGIVVPLMNALRHGIGAAEAAETGKRFSIHLPLIRRRVLPYELT